MNIKQKILIGVTAGIALLAMLANVFTTRHNAKLQAQITAAQGAIAAAEIVHRNDSLEIAFLTARVATRDTVILTRRETRAEPLQRRVGALPAAALPDTCLPAIAARDSLLQLRNEDIRDLESNQDDLQSSLRLAVRDAEIWQEAAEKSRIALDGAAKVVNTRPRFTLLPKLGVGGFAGACTTGLPCAGVGVTLGWRF